LNGALRALVMIAAAVAAAIMLGSPVAAHGSETGLYLDRPSSWPGGSLIVRGDVPSTGPIELVLADTSGRSSDVLVARIDDAPNGHFEIVATMPNGVRPGSWSFEARAVGMPSVATHLELTPVAGPDEGDGSAADGAVAATEAPAATPTIAPRPTALTTPDVDVVPVVAAALAIMALVALGRWTRCAAPTR
jgi:hypothetical protein